MRLVISSKMGKYKNNVLLLSSSVVLGSIGQMLMKSGASGAEIKNIYSLISTIFEPLVILGLAAYVLSSALWLVVLTRIPLSVAYPFGAISYLLVVLFSILNGEPISIIRSFGVILIITGILLVGKNTTK